ncbi:hypothetical protein H4R18_002759 [Coemansia javaensis]|uniref:KOW domain-containing protein n=1 Tax=Coemansia javaensis TaxID=2761396 RepID=A0A9W8HFR7_9FUNG|nr:hypothetical protein H4R18_002759 [Coemansia javaensis]
MSTRIAPRDRSLPKDQRLKRWKIFKGDTVMVISGKDHGKTGPVSQVSRKTNCVYVRGLKLGAKSIPQGADGERTTTQVEMPIHVSNVALVDPSTGRPAKVRLARVDNPETQKTETRRFSVDTGTYIPRKVDTSYQEQWKDGAFDTDPEAVARVSFQPEPGVPPFPADLLREVKNRYKKHY